jgi:hypothetical protein
LLAVYDGSEPHRLLLEEMAYSEGEALIFANAGLDARVAPEAEQALIDAGRLIVASPLPPAAAYRPAWDAVLRQVAIAAAHSVIITGAPTGGISALTGETKDRPTLVLSASPLGPAALGNAESHEPIVTTTLPADVLVWIDTLLATTEQPAEAGAMPEAVTPAASGAGPSSAHVDIDTVARRLGESGADDLGPPPTTGEIIDTLEKGGAIPEVLLRRLRGE